MNTDIAWEPERIVTAFYDSMMNEDCGLQFGSSIGQKQSPEFTEFVNCGAYPICQESVQKLYNSNHNNLNPAQYSTEAEVKSSDGHIFHGPSTSKTDSILDGSFTSDINVNILLEHLSNENESDIVAEPLDMETFLSSSMSIEPKTLNVVSSNIGMYAGVRIYGDESNGSDSSSTTEPMERTWVDLLWMCHRCRSKCKFTTLKDLREHTKRKHKVCTALHCGHCNFAFELFEDWVGHMTGHYAELRHYCPICNIKLDNNSNPKHHEEFHKEIENICSACGEQFESADALTAHVAKFKMKEKKVKTEIETKTPDNPDESWRGYRWLCVECQDCFPSVEAIREHAKTSHGKCYTMRCVDCDEGFDTYVNLVRHIRRHRPYLKYHCEYCNYQYTTPDEESVHLIKHFDHKNLSCRYCAEIFPTEDQRTTHTNTYKPRKPDRRRRKPITIADLKCKFCSFIGKKLGTLKQHQQIHMKREKNMICEICSKGFYSKNALSTHKSVVHSTKNHICKICFKAFCNATVLRRHVNTHSNIKPYECNECGRMFRLKKHLSDHWIVHTDSMPYPCTYCDKKFKHSSVLRVHKLQHTGERPYHCPECPKDFANFSNMSKHYKRIHCNIKDRPKPKLAGHVTQLPDHVTHFADQVTHLADQVTQFPGHVTQLADHVTQLPSMPRQY